MLSNKAKKILSDPGLMHAREKHLQRLSDLFSGRHLDAPFVLFGNYGGGKSDFYSQPEKWVEEALADLAARADVISDNEVFRPIGVNPWPYGVHFIDKLLGADVFELEGEPGNWQVKPLPPEFGRLPLPDLDSHPAWKLARRAAIAFNAADVTLPFFAPAVLSSPLNILLNIYGQEALVGMLAEPEAIARDLRVITDIIKTLHAWYRSNVRFEALQMIEVCGRIQPPGHGQICGCSTQLLSPELYREFIAPLDEEILSLHPGGGMLHLCGAHAHLIPIWKEMKSLSAIQVNDRAAEDLELYFCNLRADQIIYAKPCQGMLLEKIMKITHARRTVIVQDAPVV